jgi:hypothetical protein
MHTFDDGWSIAFGACYGFCCESLIYADDWSTSFDDGLLS